jgi:hypothetical protein
MLIVVVTVCVLIEIRRHRQRMVKAFEYGSEASSSPSRSPTAAGGPGAPKCLMLHVK